MWSQCQILSLTISIKYKANFHRKITTNTKVIILPKVCRLKDLATKLKVNQHELVKRIGVKSRKRIYCNFNTHHDLNEVKQLVWYQFPSLKDIIIPYDFAKYFVESIMKIKVSLEPSINDSTYCQPILTQNIPDKPKFAVILGHFNHGKTTVLDQLGGTSVVALEDFGITQVIRTKFVKLNSNKFVSFIDTPGQDIFFRMRNYGASVADIAVLVVAIDEGVSHKGKLIYFIFSYY